MTEQEKFEKLAIAAAYNPTKDTDGIYTDSDTYHALRWFCKGIEVAKQDSAAEIAELKAENLRLRAKS